MHPHDDPALAAERLEAALERIAQSATLGMVRAARTPDFEQAEPQFDRVEVVARLDGIIAELRAVLNDVR